MLAGTTPISNYTLLLTHRRNRYVDMVGGVYTVRLMLGRQLMVEGSRKEDCRYAVMLGYRSDVIASVC